MLSLPLIGITCDYEPSEKMPGRLDICQQHAQFYQALERAEALPVLIPAVSDEAKLRGYLQRLDGLLFSGAPDIPPAAYGEEPHEKTVPMSSQRFEFEYALARLALKSQLPLMGICGGIQMMSTAAGGTVVQDIPSQIDNPLIHRTGKAANEARHEINVKPGSRFSTIFKDRAITNTSHHQAVKEVGEGFEVVAWTDDGVNEAIEMPGDRFAIGVQWHPERWLDGLPGMLQLFEEFTSACREYVSGKLSL
jgi:putative glutamine amidotransferase